MGISRTRMLPIGTTQASAADFIQAGQAVATTAGTVVLFATTFSATPRVAASCAIGTEDIQVSDISAGSFTLTTVNADSTVDYIAMVPHA